MDKSSPISGIPDELLAHILSFVPDSDLSACVRVCKHWCKVIQLPSFWKIKCLKCGRDIKELVTIPSREWRMVYFKNPYGRNLVKNSCGEIYSEGKKAGDARNFSYIISLLKVGSCYAMYAYAARADCASVWEMRVTLCREKAHKVERYLDEYAQRFNRDSWNAHSVLMPDDWKHGDSDLVIESYNYGPQETPQWSNSDWTKVSHTFQGCSPGLRTIIFEDASKDMQFWAGHYGGKMSAASVFVRVKKS
uniref:F-box only protein 6-like n=1 Tax=Saccoglossus kowalevskii TaxID=10224 RepID=A0ABM0LZ21_SACKO|nr:PREDICTED: F-box only protein 6-like [Saccoglossus kowalevskii]